MKEFKYTRTDGDQEDTAMETLSKFLETNL